jgi:hypothetical protein
MSFKIVYPDFISACYGYTYGKRFLDCPDDVQQMLNDYFDGCEVTESGVGSDPDNVYLNGFVEWTLEETVVDNLSMLSLQEFKELKGNDELSEWVDENIEQIESEISDMGYFYLGRDGYESWYLLQ